MLGQGCLRAFSGERFIFTESGFKMGFCQCPETGPKVGQNAPKPTFYPLLTHFGIATKTLSSQLNGGGNRLLKRALRQSRPSITVTQVLLCSSSWGAGQGAPRREKPCRMPGPVLSRGSSIVTSKRGDLRGGLSGKMSTGIAPWPQRGVSLE